MNQTHYRVLACILYHLWLSVLLPHTQTHTVGVHSDLDQQRDGTVIFCFIFYNVCRTVATILVSGKPRS